MSILPANPTDGQIFTYGNKTWQWSEARSSWTSVSTVTNVTGPGGATESISDVVRTSTNYTMVAQNDLIIGTHESPITITLPDASVVKSYYFQNAGTGSMTLQPVNSQQINGDTTLVIQFPGSSCRLISTGSEFLIF